VIASSSLAAKSRRLAGANKCGLQFTPIRSADSASKTPLTVIANLCRSFAVVMCGQSLERGNRPAQAWKGTIVKKLLVSTLVAASLATAPAHAGNYDGLIAGGIIAGGLLAAAAAAAAANNQPHVIYQQGPTRVIYKRGPTRIIRVAAPRPAPHKAAVVAPPAHHAAPAWTDLHQGAAAAD
jgi:hypothetical protein